MSIASKWAVCRPGLVGAGMVMGRRMGTVASVAVLVASMAVACGTTAEVDQVADVKPHETVAVGQLGEPREVEETAQVTTEPGETPEREAARNGASTPVPTTTMMVTAVVVTPNAPVSTKPADGQVYVAPRRVPTDTPVPTPSPTLDAGAEPPTIWNQFSREDYEVLIPDPALGVSWGHALNGHQDSPKNTTPDGINQNFDLAHAPFAMMHTLAVRMLDGVTGTAAIGNWDFYKTGYSVKRASAQWEWVHPEIPLARAIIEAEFYAQPPSSDILVWRAGAHFIMKDTYQKKGRVWQTSYEPEIIGPVVVEQTTCEGLLMPYLLHPTLGAQCSP